MKKIFLRNLGQVATTVALVVSGAPALAVDTWNLGGCADSTNLGSVVTCANPGVVLSGYSNQTDTSTTDIATINGKTFSAANIYDWGSAGLGVVATSENAGTTGPHATDNKFGIDAMMIKFTGGAVNLTGLTIGWNGTDKPTNSGYADSDLSVFAWTGNASPTSLTSLSPTGLFANAGWQLVGNHSDVGSNSNNQLSLSSSTYSSYWLVSAYSQAYGHTWTQGNDAFKLLSLAGTPCAGTVTNGSCGTGGGGNGVPEPGSLALMGAAMMGFVASRRRKQQAA